MQPLGISQNRLARAMCVPPRRINEIVHGQRAITADTALRLAHVLAALSAVPVGSLPDRLAEGNLRHLRAHVRTIHRLLGASRTPLTEA